MAFTVYLLGVPSFALQGCREQVQVPGGGTSLHLPAATVQGVLTGVMVSLRVHMIGAGMLM